MECYDKLPMIGELGRVDEKHLAGTDEEPIALLARYESVYYGKIKMRLSFYGFE